LGPLTVMVPVPQPPIAQGLPVVTSMISTAALSPAPAVWMRSEPSSGMSVPRSTSISDGLPGTRTSVTPSVSAAMLAGVPVLTFLAMMAGIVGGALVGSTALDISLGMFISRLNEMTEIRHFWVGMAKAPVFAFLIGTIGCLEGFKVEGSAESVGRHTTASVVQAIFLVIVFDALFAIFFMELGV